MPAGLILWNNENQDEPNTRDISPIVKSYLQPFLEAKGIQINEEKIDANGNLVFLCTYTYNGTLFKVGIELIVAHNENLLKNLTQRFPQYLKNRETKQGIFLVLWFKNDNFRQPEKYASITDLKNDLVQNISEKYQIQIMTIDCQLLPE